MWNDETTAAAGGGEADAKGADEAQGPGSIAEAIQADADAEAKQAELDDKEAVEELEELVKEEAAKPDAKEDGEEGDQEAEDGAKGEDGGKDASKAETPGKDADAAADGKEKKDAKAEEEESGQVTADELKEPEAFKHIPEKERAAVQRTWGRMTRALVSEHEVRVQAQDAYEALAKPLRESTATNEQLGMMLWAVKAMNSGDPKALERVDTFFKQQRGMLAEALGKVPEGVDPMQDPMNADLAAKVAAGDLDAQVAAQWAKERVAQRGQNKHYAGLTEHQRQAAQAQATEKQARDTANAGLRKSYAILKQHDPDLFDRMVPYLNEVAKRMSKTGVPPSQWVEHMNGQIIMLEGVMKAGSGTNGSGKKEHDPDKQPLRPGRGTPGLPKSEPKTMAEAIARGQLEGVGDGE